MSDPLPCKIVAEHPDWVPRYQTPGAACADLRAWLPEGELIVNPGRVAAVDCGFSMALPPGWKAEISARSGHAAAGFLVANAPGQVDEDYRGRVKVLVHCIGPGARSVGHGDRVAQMWLSPVHRFSWYATAELDATGRGAGGFGSTGAGGKGAAEPIDPHTKGIATVTEIEHLLFCLAEECAEVVERCTRVAVRASKAVRFGLGEVQPGQDRTNAERLADELKDLLAVAEALEAAGAITRAQVDRKKGKLATFMAYSRSLGVLDSAPPDPKGGA